MKLIHNFALSLRIPPREYQFVIMLNLTFLYIMFNFRKSFREVPVNGTLVPLKLKLFDIDFISKL